MSIDSTRRRNTKAKRRQLAVSKEAAIPIGAAPIPIIETQAAAIVLPGISERVWLVSCVAILVVAAALRFYALDLKPMHHDEGVNGFFMTTLVHQGVYRYDPTNYHGPTLYYLALPTTVLFGLATIWLIFGLRRQLGTMATLAGASLLAVSPGAVYYSRYFIHESLFAFFTLAIVVAAVRFYETGRLIFVAAGSISAALLFATKETAFVSIITLGLAWIFVEVWIRRVAGPSGSGSSRRKRGAKGNEEDRATLKHLIDRQTGFLLVSIAVGLFVLVNLILYSSFFSNWKGVNDAISALAVWSKTGTSEFHGKPFAAYSYWLVAEELPILLLGAAGSAIALFERRLNRFAIFIGAWAFGLLLAYSFIPYKTPWLMLNFTVPMAIVGGHAIPVLLTRFTFVKPWWASLSLLGVLILSVGTYQSVVLSFRQYDNDAYPYVYAHSSRELLALVAEVERLAARASRPDVGISVAAPEYWPLPWYFRNNPRVGFIGTVATAYDANETPLVIGRESPDPAQDQSRTLSELLGAEYQQAGSYSLRPGVRLVLFARRQLLKP